MKCSYTTMATPKQNGVEAIKIAKKYGYQGIDLRVSEAFGEIKLKHTRNDAIEIKDALDSLDIKLSSLLCYNKCGNEIDSSWNEMYDSILSHIEIATELRSEAIRIFIDKPNICDKNKYIERIIEILQKILSIENGYSDVKILIQNHRKKCGVYDCANIIKKVNNNRLRLAFSPDHSYMSGLNMNDVLSNVKDITKQVYIADVDSRSKTTFVGNGVIPYIKIIDFFDKKGFNGWYTMKWEKFGMMI